MIKFAETHASELKAHLPKEPKAYEMFMHSLQLRINVMETYMLEEMKEKLEDYPENIEDFSFFMRDRMMAEQFQWVAETLYPKKKIIVWGHNYHLRKQNTKMLKDWVQLNGPNMGDYLPERLKNKHIRLAFMLTQVRVWIVQIIRPLCRSQARRHLEVSKPC